MRLNQPTRIATFIAACLLMLPVTRAEDAKSVFDALFAAKIKSASATVDRADDVALAKELLALAKTSTNQPDLVALLCDTAHDMGARHADGYQAAAEAMTLLADTVEENRPAAREKLIVLLTRQSAAGKPDEREAAGEALIDLLITIGDEKAQKKQYPEAVADYRRAVAIASQKKSASLEDAKAKMEFAQSRDRTTKTLARLQEKLLKDANDFATAEDIVKLYIVELDDPESAKAYLNRVKDEQLTLLIPLAAQPADQLNLENALKLGEWYLTLARASAKPVPSVLGRAESYLSHFLASHKDEGLLRTKAQALLSEVAAAQAKLTATDLATLGRRGPPAYLRDAAIVYTFDSANVIKSDSKLIVRDISGNGNDGTIEGAKTVNGISGNALFIESSASVVRSKTSIGIAGNTPRTVSFWLRIDKNNINDNFQLLRWGEDVENGQFGIVIWDGHYYLWAYGGRFDWSGILPASTDWQHHAITHDGKTIRWYINGIATGKTRDQMYDTKDNDLIIGRSPIGLLDELAIFKRELSKEDVQKLFQTSKRGLKREFEK